LKKTDIRLSLIPVYSLVFLVILLWAILGNKAITVMSESSPLTDRLTIIIDAGHGGEDGGATSCTGYLESGINLEIALRLEDMMHFLGYNTIMVRTTDTAIHVKGDTIAGRKASDLRERVKLVNETKNAILISVHQNYFSDDRYSGAQVFYTMVGNSEQLGKLLQKNIVTTLNKTSKRQAKKASGVYLLDHIDCTGVLIECGFLSNPQEELKLRSSTYQKQLCAVIAATVGSFLA